MKTIYGQCLSVKDISLSKATKIISKFAFADNGASEVVSAYLHRASSSFIELDNLHKEQRHKRQEETGAEKSTHTKLNGSIDFENGNLSGIEKQKKNKISAQESRIDGDSILKGGGGEIDGKSTVTAQDEGKKKKKKLKEEEVKMEGRKKRKNDDLERSHEDRSVEPTEKRMKRKHDT